MMLRYLFLFILICFHTLVFAQQDLGEKINKVFSREVYKNAQTGISIIDNTTGNVLYESNHQKLFIPASVMKLVTTASALEILGPNYRFKTRLYYSGKIENGILNGDLIIVGGGDPALGSDYFPEFYFTPHFLEKWARLIGEAGITSVAGRVVTDNSFYSNEQIPPTWNWEDIGNYYGAGANALAYHDNLLKITFQSPASPGMLTRIVSIDPEVKELSWQNEVRSSDIPRDRAYVFGSPIDNRRIIRGTIPKNRSSFTIKASNPYPEKTLAEEFARHLSRVGIHVSGNISQEKVLLQNMKLLAELQSPILSEIIKVVNHESVNLFAEHLVMQIAAEANGLGDRTVGLNLISEFWEEKGMNTSELFMEDGSGLSHFNAVTPSFINSMLRYMKITSTYSNQFFESLPVAGTGTLKAFNAPYFLENSLRLKSGSMKRIRCYAGYIITQSGKDLSVAILINHFDGNHSKLMSELEKIFIEIGKE